LVKSIAKLTVFDSPGSKIRESGESFVQPHDARIRRIRNVFGERFVTFTSDSKFEVATTFLSAALNDLSGPWENDSAITFETDGLQIQNRAEVGIIKPIILGKVNDRSPFREGL